MNKHIINVLSNYDFSYEKNRGYGHINGYEVNVVINNAMAAGPLFFFSTYLSQTKKNDFIIKLREKKFKLVQANAFDFGIVVLIGSATGGTFEKKFANVLSQILEILEELEAPKSEICPQSGEQLVDEESRLADIPNLNIKVKLTNKAIEALNVTIEQYNENFEVAPNNYLQGFGGIAIGAAAGFLMTIIFSLIGIISVFSPLVAIYLGVYLYKKFGAKPNAIMIVMSFVATFAAIMVALIIVYLLAATGLAVSDGYNYTGFIAFTYYLRNSDEFSSSFFYDIFMNIIFILLAEGVSIFSLVKGIKKPEKIN